MPPSASGAAPGSEAILLEVLAVVECVAPAPLHVDRFLPATPIRVVVDHALAEHTQDEALSSAPLEKGDIFRLLDRGAVKKKLLPAMFAQTQDARRRAHADAGGRRHRRR